jgi:hypothetical protein
MLLMFAEPHCTRLVAPAVELKVHCDRLGFSAKPGFFGAAHYDYFEAVFVNTATVRLIGFVRPANQSSASTEAAPHTMARSISVANRRRLA